MKFVNVFEVKKDLRLIVDQLKSSVTLDGA